MYGYLLAKLALEESRRNQLIVTLDAMNSELEIQK